jgi:hypothetical protein
MIIRLVRLVVIVAATASLLAVASPAQATSPPPKWTNLRVLDCGPDGVLTTYLAPPGIGSSFNVVDSTEVLHPVKLVVTGTVNGQVYDHVTTLDTPGFDHNNAATVHCTYTDPVGLFVEMTAHVA